MFLRVVERGSLSAAARDCGITPSTVSRSLAELEKSYGATLLMRSTRARSLTESGRLVYEQAVRTVHGDNILRERLADLDGEFEGPLRIAAPSGFGAYVVAAFCGRFIERHPLVSIDLRLSDRAANLVEEGIDVAVRIGRLSDSALFAKRLAALDEVLVAHPACLGCPVQCPADLARVPWIAFAGLQDGTTLTLRRDGLTEALDLKPRMTTDQIVGHREALLAGAGAGAIHRYAVDADIAAGRLVELLPDWNLPTWPVHAVFPVKEQTLRLQRWTEELRRAIAGIPGAQSDEAGPLIGTESMRL